QNVLGFGHVLRAVDIFAEVDGVGLADIERFDVAFGGGVVNFIPGRQDVIGRFASIQSSMPTRFRTLSSVMYLPAFMVQVQVDSPVVLSWTSTGKSMS